MYVYVYMYMYMCVCVHVSTHIRVYIYIYIYIKCIYIYQIYIYILHCTQGAMQQEQPDLKFFSLQNIYMHTSIRAYIRVYVHM